MAPLAGALMLLLLVLVPIGFASGRIDLTERLPGPARRPGLLWLSLSLYPVFLLGAELDASLVAAATVFALYFVCARSVLAGTDWVLLAVFALMFVDLGLLARLPAVSAAAAELGNAPGGMLTAGILLSQFLSNVPATIFLAEFTDDWRTLAWAVSIGGFGLAIGSMANLIALRLAREPGLWWAFHAWSVPVLAAGWMIAWLTIGG
jgi:Na+/H+ antiporter NhaD/arsenite permease-like protein